MPGHLFGKYDIRQRLNESKTSLVLRAFDTQLERMVILRVLLPALAADRMALSRFAQEIQAIQSFHHPGISETLEFGDLSGLHYLSSVDVPGQSLEQTINTRGSLGRPELIKLVRSLGMVLNEIHRHGLIHGNVHPGNIICMEVLS